MTRRTFRKALLALLIAAAVPLLAFTFRASLPLSDTAYVDFERTWRRAFYDVGIILPGTPPLGDLEARLKARGLTLGAPVALRLFKREFELEVWIANEGRYALFATYPICRWSGDLGPKLQQGDKQAPEGFYTVDASLLNPNSQYHRSFNLGYPNAFDREKGRTGSLLMVHGSCASIGCYAMTNAGIDEIWQLVTSALNGGQPRFPVAVFPFRLSEANLASRAESPNAPFWKNLKTGYDLFEKDRLPPEVSVCKGAYAFRPSKSIADGNAPIEPRCP